MSSPRSDTMMEVYEVVEGSDPPESNDHISFMLELPATGPPSVGDTICLSAAAVPPGDNPYVIDAHYKVLARSYMWLPRDTSDGTTADEHTFKKIWLVVRRLKTADIRAGKHLI